MYLKTPLALLPCVLAGLLLAGCHDSNSGAGSTGGGSATTPTTGTTGTTGSSGGELLAFVTNNPSDYWTICRKGTEAAQKELPGVKVQFIMPSPGTVATQRSEVDDLLTKGVKGIAISPVDPSNETTYLNGVAAQTSLITSDSDAPQSKRLCYIGTDNHAAGMMAADLIKEAIPQGGKIILFVGSKDAQNAHDRIQGITDELKAKAPNIQVVDIRTDDADHARAKQNAADMLTAHPDLACLVGIYSYNGPAIVSALQDASKIGKVKIVCFDQEQGTMDGIKSGAVYGTVVQDPYTFGYQSIKLLDQLAKGNKSGIPPTKQLFIPTEAIKQANLAKYLADYNKKIQGGA